MNFKTALLWICQLIAAGILLRAGVAKFLSVESTVTLFTSLGMEPFGRYLIATIECASALLLLTKHFAAIGALLTVATMCGALIAHITKLGVLSSFDEAHQLIPLLLLLSSSGIVLYARRRSIPLVGDIF